MKFKFQNHNLFEISQIFLKLAKRERQNKQIRAVLHKSKKWRKNGHFENEILAELKTAKMIFKKVSKILKNVKMKEEKMLDRLTEHYYEPVGYKIQSLTTFHNGYVLGTVRKTRILLQ